MSFDRLHPAIVCVPAHQEAGRIARLLASLSSQKGFCADRRLPVLLYANNCRDGTADIARAFASSPRGASLDLTVVEADLPTEEAHVGTARRRAMELAGERISMLDDGILLTTDADARLPESWVVANLVALSGAEIVGGRLVIDLERPDARMTTLNQAIESYWDRVRAVEAQIDPQAHDLPPRHGDHTGASLALRLATYRAVGGLPPLPRGEDNALVARVVEAGGRLRHDPKIFVHVSDRAVGRAAGGMASEMTRRQAVLDGRETYRLPSPTHWHRIVARRAALRALWWQGPEAAPAALRGFGLPDAAITEIASRACPNDIAFVERAHNQLEPYDNAAPLVTLDEALSRFDAL